MVTCTTTTLLALGFSAGPNLMGLYTAETTGETTGTGPCDDPTDPFKPTCEQARGFGLCNRTGPHGEVASEVWQACNATCSFAGSTKGHGLHEEGAERPSDYGNQGLPPQAIDLICAACESNATQNCCHNHPHPPGKRQLQVPETGAGTCKLPTDMVTTETAKVKCDKSGSYDKMNCEGKPNPDVCDYAFDENAFYQDSSTASSCKALTHCGPGEGMAGVAPCDNGCVCKDDYVFDRSTNKCVKTSECPASSRCPFGYREPVKKYAARQGDELKNWCYELNDALQKLPEQDAKSTCNSLYQIQQYADQGKLCEWDAAERKCTGVAEFDCE